MAVYKRGNVWWCEFQVNGKRVRQTTRETSKRKAQEVERQIRNQISNDLHHQRIGKPLKRTFGDAMLKWLDVAPESMLSHARNVRPYLDDVMLAYVPSAASDMKSDMIRRGLSNQTINRRLAVVKRILNLAFKEWDWIALPLAQKISLLSEKDTSREVFLSREEVTTLVAAIDNEGVKQFILLLAYTGLRKSELFKLQPEQWTPPNIILRSNTKSGKPRPVPLIPEFHEYMENLPITITPWELRVAFESAREKLEMPWVRMHDLRHTFASWLIADPDVSMAVVRDLLGHSSLAVTSKYSHLRGDHSDLINRVLSTHKNTTNKE